SRGDPFVKVPRTGRRPRRRYEDEPALCVSPAEPSASDTGTELAPGGGISVMIGVRPSPVRQRPVRASLRIRMARGDIEGLSRFRNRPQRADASGGTVG